MNQQLSWRTIVGYSLGDVANNFAFAMGALFLLSYYTDVAGVGAAAAGTMLLLVRVFDAFADVFAGRVVDSVNTRWGKFRPFLLFGTVDSIGQRNSYVKTWGCGGFLNETNIYSRGKSLCF
ncbi:Glucuronide transport protein [Escherichia coli]|nr:Glucuronide transport protein [Escherichia coli]